MFHGKFASCLSAGNKTGSISVQVIDKSQGRYTVLKSFGTGWTESELSILEAKARGFIREKQGLVNCLFPEPLDNHIEDFVSSLSNSQLQVIGLELVFGALSNKIEYDSIDNELFRHLVITQLFHPGSKLKTIDYLYRYQGRSYSADRIYPFLDELCYRWGKEHKGKPDMKEMVEAVAYAHTHKVTGWTPGIVF